MATEVDVFTGAAVAADDDDAIGAVLPPSSTNDKYAYVSALMAFEGVCIEPDRERCQGADEEEAWIFFF